MEAPSFYSARFALASLVTLVAGRSFGYGVQLTHVNVATGCSSCSGV